MQYAAKGGQKIVRNINKSAKTQKLLFGNTYSCQKSIEWLIDDVITIPNPIRWLIVGQITYEWLIDDIIILLFDQSSTGWLINDVIWWFFDQSTAGWLISDVVITMLFDQSPIGWLFINSSCYVYCSVEFRLAILRRWLCSVAECGGFWRGAKNGFELCR